MGRRRGTSYGKMTSECGRPFRIPCRASSANTPLSQTATMCSACCRCCCWARGSCQPIRKPCRDSSCRSWHYSDCDPRTGARQKPAASCSCRFTTWETLQSFKLPLVGGLFFVLFWVRGFSSQRALEAQVVERMAWQRAARGAGTIPDWRDEREGGKRGVGVVGEGWL
jgi:hypothetical protein